MCDKDVRIANYAILEYLYHICLLGKVLSIKHVHFNISHLT